MKVRILHLITRLPFGGAERLLVDLVRRLDPQRYESIVCCIQARDELAGELERAGTRVICLERMRTRRFDFGAILALRRLVREERISLIHSHLYHANLYGRLAALLARVPAIATVHNVYTRSKFHRRQLNRWLAKVSARVVAVSDEVRHDLVEVDGIAPGKAVTICNGVDPQRVRTALTREQARARLGIDAGTVVVGCVGRLEEQKGHRYLLEACAALPVEVVLVGDGRLRADLEARAAALGGAHRTHFLGARSDIAELLKAFDIYAMPSLWEGLPVALLEAMAAGLPAVVSDVGAVAHVLDGGRCGVLVPPKNVGALAAALQSLAADPARRRALGDAARERAVRHFSLDAMVANIASVYDEVLHDSAAGRS